MGWAHAHAVWALRDERGQGTVEYVGIMLLLATLMGAVVLAVGKGEGNGIDDIIVGKLKSALNSIGK
ncbi:MAG: hypothetical protein H0U79_08235 [Solirubrobacterales bacterium]|nr:hypothetical protein [Solirubrobacterales bacterium]